MKIMPKKICFNGNGRPIRYENWNGAVAIRYDGNRVLQIFPTSHIVGFFERSVLKEVRFLYYLHNNNTVLVPKLKNLAIVYYTFT